jgi:asparagine synthase (glutamine-hydrolysing)
MCGIAGAVCYGAEAIRIDHSVVERLNWLQRRRGPDGSSLWTSDDCRTVLGHRRLAVIDTGAQGIQPMSDATGRWTVTFNGEIYNYQALRLELERAGRVFLSSSDTEVLINVIAQWGEPGLLKLRGMYAFALWDSLEQELWLVRDPFGIKPLYVAEHRGTMWFASQAQALATCAPIDIRRDAAALVGFYLWGHVPEPSCWWTGIRMFPAGHIQRVGVGRASAPRPFASIQDSYVGGSQPLEPGELRGVLLDSVRHHLVADVPVGIFLSAGIDSNIIAALAAELGTRPRTVTLAFKEYAGTNDDEAPLAEATARALKTEHVTVRIDRDEFDAVLDDFFDCMDQPSIDGLNTYLVSRAAAQQGLKVALSGLGGDELFGGYPSFRQIPRLLRWASWAGRLPSHKALSRGIQRAVRLVAPSIVPPKVAGLLAYSGDIAEAYLLRRALYLEDELDGVLDETRLREGLERLATVAAITQSIAGLHKADATMHAKISALECRWYMRNQLLRDTDWAGMAHGLEVRVPYVDLALFKRLAPVIGSGSPPSKKDLAACAEPALRISSERPKTGFTTPVRVWVTRKSGPQPRGLRGWAAEVHRRFRFLPRPHALVLPDAAA